jgi:hypothetical protein
MQEDEAGGSQASLDYIVKPCLKKKKKLKRVEVERGTKRALA